MKVIEFIKDEYSNPTPLLYTYKGCIENSLVSRDFNKATNITVASNVNEVSTLEFEIPFSKDRKLDYNSVEKLVYFDKTYFIIKEIETDTSNMNMKVNCEELSTVLKGIPCEAISQIGQTAEIIFNAIIGATKFTNIGFSWLYTDVPNTTLRHLIADSGVSCYENLVSLAKVFNGSIQFTYDINGQGYVSLVSQPTYTNKFIKKDIDIKSLTITSSSRETFSKIYPTGATDSNTGIVLDIQDVNNGQSILVDQSFYKQMGIPNDVIARDPQYQQLKTISDDTYVSSSDLLQYAKEELTKSKGVQFSAECTILDLACYVDSPIEHPRVNMGLKCIDKSLNLVFDCLITGIERNYNNPLETKLTISNIIPYTSSFQSLQATSGVISKVISTTNGVPTVNVNYMSGILNAQNTSLIGTVDNTTPSSSQSTLAISFEDKRIGYPAYGAMGFGTKGLCIAKELNQDGTWKWQTFGDVNGFNASLIKTGILNGNNGDFSLNLDTGQTTVPTQLLTTSDKQIANTEFVTNKLNERQNIVVGTMTKALTVGEGDITLTINGLGINPILVTNGNYSLNTAQIVGITNTTTDTITVHYINGIAGNCKLNYTYSK